MTDAAWQLLENLVAWRVTEVPRRAQPRQISPAGGDRLDLGMAQRAQALVTAFHHGGAVAFGWIREQAGGPIKILAAGRALSGTDGNERVVLTLPAGGRGDPVPPGAAARSFAAMPCWMRLAGIADGLLDSAPDGAPTDIPPSLEDGLLTAWPDPFAWLVLAEPASTERLTQLAEDINVAHLHAQRSDSPRAQLAARRLEARHAEIRKATATGMWRVHLLAGGKSPSAAARIAGLLCASADLDDVPYELVPMPGCASLDKLLDRPTIPPNPASARADDQAPQPEAPFWASSKLLAAVARPPTREVPGIRFVFRPNFDVTPESALSGAAPPVGAVTETAPAVVLGSVLDWNRMPAGQLTVSQSSLNRHTFVCGATGAGKSQTVRGLLEAASAAGIPWLVVEPAKAEYKLMAARLPGTEVIRIRPGEVDQPPAGINPLEPAPGPDGTRFPLQTHADLVRALFLAAFEADEPFPQVLAAALTRCYEDTGWDLVTGEPATAGTQPGYPALGDLQATAMQVVEEIGYGREITDNVRGFVRVRISSLRLGTTGRFFEGGHPLDFARLLDHNVVFEIEDAGDDRDKAFLMGTVLIRLTEYLRMRQRAEGSTAPRLRHLSVFEEAHRLLRNPQGPDSGPAAHAVDMFAGLLAEIRAYGEGLIIAEQIPAKLVPDVIKNTAVKIVHRLPAADDREAVGATMNVTDEQSQYLVTLVPGEAAVFTDGMDYPLLARMPDGTAREPQWLAPAYRWALVLDSLKNFHRNNQDAGPHPRTAEWEATYRQTIPGQTCARQLGAVQRWYDADQRNQTAVHGVAYGTRSETAIERAVGARCGDEDWEQRLADSLTTFRECRWPADYLRPARADPQAGI